MDRNDIRTHITGHDLFKGLTHEAIDFLADCATVREVKAGEVVFRFDDVADRFYLLLSGAVSIEVAALEGPPLELQSLGPDKVLGWSWLIPPYTWSFQARATEATTLVEFDGVAILARCEEDPAFGFQLLKRFSALMSERLAYSRQRMMEAWQPAGYA